MHTTDKLSFKEWYKKLIEMMTGYTGAIVGSCKGGPDFQVQGACSDLKKKRKSIKESSGLTPEQKQIKQQLLTQYAHLQPAQMLPLPENPALYFQMEVPGVIMVPMNKLSNIRARPEGIQNALMMMYANSIGKSPLPKRVPISVRPMGNGTYEVFDGNSTYNIAKQSGWKQIPARVVDEAGNLVGQQ